MRMPIAVALLLLVCPSGHAEETSEYDDIVQLSPDLYLLLYRARMEPYVTLRINAIKRANDFAASKGGVAVPVTGRYGALGITLKIFEYQFRVMSHEDAVAMRPVMADAVIAVNNTGQCSPNAAVATVLPDLRGIASLGQLDLLARLPRAAPEASAAPPPASDNGAGTLCLPGQICQPAQTCLPGWECNPGTLPSPTPSPAAGATGQ
jgi:hypothetical protein